MPTIDEIKKINKFIIYYIYPNKDDIMGDEWGIDVELNGKVITKYGDYYHDKGSEKAKGFIDGYAYAKNWKEKIDYTINCKNRIVKEL